MNTRRELYEVELRSGHQPTGKTRHELNGVLLPLPARLRIAQYEGDPGYYLLYCDETGCEMTDTYHDSVEQTMAQANWEFNIKAEEWTPLGASIVPSSICDVVFETIDPRSRNVQVYKENVIHSLEELADIRIQRRRWLSAGGPEVSSFTEAICQLFDDTGLGDALEKLGALPVFSASIDDRLRELSMAVGRFDHDIEPQKQIDHPDMQTIRELAARILAEIGALKRNSVLGSPEDS